MKGLLRLYVEAGSGDCLGALDTDELEDAFPAAAAPLRAWSNEPHDTEPAPPLAPESEPPCKT